MSAHWYGQPIPRGVYTLPYPDSEGRTLLIAIDRRGRAVGGAVRVLSSERNGEVAHRLWGVLERMDPSPEDGDEWKGGPGA